MTREPRPTTDSDRPGDPAFYFHGHKHKIPVTAQSSRELLDFLKSKRRYKNDEDLRKKLNTIATTPAHSSYLAPIDADGVNLSATTISLYFSQRRISDTTTHIISYLLCKYIASINALPTSSNTSDLYARLDGPALVDEFYKFKQQPKDPTVRAGVERAATSKFADALYSFFHSSTSSAEDDDIELQNSFYYCYKRSYRFNVDDICRDDRKFIRSILYIRRATKMALPLFEDYQRNSHDISPQEEELSQGTCFISKSQIFLFGQEVATHQPRLFWLRARSMRRDSSDASGPERVQSFVGYCFEGYAKYDGALGNKGGAFFSPVGLERIADHDVESKIRERVALASIANGGDGASDTKSAEDHPPLWDDTWINYGRQCLVDFATIVDNVDELNINDANVKQHMSASIWVDSAWPIRNIIAPVPSTNKR